MDEVENHAKKQKFIANTYPHTPAKLDEVSNFSRMDDEQLKEEDDEMSSSGDDSDSS
jgi:hypothetical protein